MCVVNNGEGGGSWYGQAAQAG